MLRAALLAGACFLSTNVAIAGPAEQLSAILNGRVGGASEDRREDIFDIILGIKVKTECKGDTLEASVKIDRTSVEISGYEATIIVDYSGKYYRQGWIKPCIKVPEISHGLEQRDVSGKYTFKVTSQPFTRPVVTWNGLSGLPHGSDPNHDSNVFAVRAVQDAIGKAF